MSSTSEEEQDREKESEAFRAAMQTRIEQAQAGGQTPDQIRGQAMAYARQEARQQAPQVVAQTRSWLAGFRNFLVIGALAFGLAFGLALSVDHYYASPLCEQYAAQHNLVFKGLYYPEIGSSSTSSLGGCMVVDAAGRSNTIEFTNVEPNPILPLLASFALQLEITIPALFIVVALIAVGISKLR